MSNFPFDLIGFDLDGTLVDSVGDLAAAVNHVLGAAGRAPLPVEQVRPMIGGGAGLMLERALTATGGVERLDELLPVLVDYYAAHLADRTRPFPHVVEALDSLSALGATLAVVTNKLEHLSVKLLKELGLLDRFAMVIGGDTVGVGKPDPAPIREMMRRCGTERAAFVGDSIYDVEAARRAGIPIVLFATDDSGDSLGADASIADYSSLAATLEKLAT